MAKGSGRIFAEAHWTRACLTIGNNRLRVASRYNFLTENGLLSGRDASAGRLVHSGIEDPNYLGISRILKILHPASTVSKLLIAETYHSNLLFELGSSLLGL